MKNKKAGEKLLSIWWIFVLLVIGGGIVLGVIIFQSKEININPLEADLLSEKISQCFSNEGYLDRNIDENNIFAECRISEKLFEKGSDFYFRVLVYEGGNLIKKIEKGDFSFEKECVIGKSIEMKNSPKCSEKSFLVLDSNGKELKIVILTSSNQKEGRIPII